MNSRRRSPPSRGRVSKINALPQSRMVRTDEEHIDIVAQGGRRKRFFTPMTRRSLSDNARQCSADAVSSIESVGEDFAVAEMIMVRSGCRCVSEDGSAGNTDKEDCETRRGCWLTVARPDHHANIVALVFFRSRRRIRRNGFYCQSCCGGGSF